MPREISIASKKLTELGLTHDESLIYTILLSEGGMSAKQLSERLGIIVNSIYRSTSNLVTSGLIKELDIKPKTFQAISPSIAIDSLAQKQIENVKEAQKTILNNLDYRKNPNGLNMDLMTGREELFDAFVDLAKQSKKEILVISVGEEVPETIWSVMNNSVKGGLKTKFIFHRNNKDNILLIKRWLAMGVPVRHLPLEGYHLNIFDNFAAILSASNTRQSHERTGVIIYNQPIVETLRTFFSQQWESAKPIKL